jgi:RhoGAP domain/Protein kinase domain
MRKKKKKKKKKKEGRRKKKKNFRFSFRINCKRKKKNKNMAAEASQNVGSTEKVVFRIYTEKSSALEKFGLASVFRTLVATRDSQAIEIVQNFVRTLAKGLEAAQVTELESLCSNLYLVTADGKTTAEFKADSKLWPVLQSLPKERGTKLMCSNETLRAKQRSFVEKSKKRRSTNRPFTRMCQGPVFDMPLPVIMEDQGSGYLPWLVEKCVTYLSAHLDVEGLFRLSGSQAEVQEISEAFDRGEDVQLEEMTTSPHVVASVLTLFVSTLPEPLLTFASYREFLALQKREPAERASHARALVDMLPEHNYALLEVLCLFLKTLASKAASNHMTSANLANIFGPVVLYCEEDRGRSVLKEVVAIIEVFQSLIDEADQIFGIETLEDITTVYNVERELGTGAFAVVKVVRHRATGTEYAAKFIDKDQLASEDVKMLEREVAILRRLRHPNIISLKAVCDTGKHLVLITELARGGELFDRIHAQGAHEEADVIKIARQLVSAIGYLHSMGIAHRDLKVCCCEEEGRV